MQLCDVKPEITFTRENWKGDIKKLVADITKIRKLGFEAKWELKAGLENLLTWFTSL